MTTGPDANITIGYVIPDAEYFEAKVLAAEEDEHPVTLTISASPTDDPRVCIELHGRTDITDGVNIPLIEALTLEDDQLSLLIDALQAARNYMRAAR